MPILGALRGVENAVDDAQLQQVQHSWRTMLSPFQSVPVEP
jgi:hypothetical protein